MRQRARFHPNRADSTRWPCVQPERWVRPTRMETTALPISMLVVRRKRFQANCGKSVHRPPRLSSAVRLGAGWTSPSRLRGGLEQSIQRQARRSRIRLLKIILHHRGFGGKMSLFIGRLGDGKKMSCSMLTHRLLHIAMAHNGCGELCFVFRRLWLIFEVG